MINLFHITRSGCFESRFQKAYFAVELDYNMNCCNRRTKNYLSSRGAGSESGASRVVYNNRNEQAVIQ